MARVHNWQLGRVMSYWYPESRPQRQFGGVFDTNKCIACQTCTLACKTTWTSGKGQEYMFWNNVESKPYGFYPLGWDVKLLQMLGGQKWKGNVYEGSTVFEAAPAGQRVLGHRPEDIDYANPNVGEDDCAGRVDTGAAFMQLPHMSWFFYLARICNHCSHPACLAACPRGSIYKRPEDGIVLVDQSRCRGYRECVMGCPYKKVFPNFITGTSEKCIGCFPKVEQGLQPQCFVNCIGKIRMGGWVSRPETAREDNPIDYLVHFRKLALPLFPQFGTEPNIYYIPPVHVPNYFLEMMFGPGAGAAVETYKKIPDDPDLMALLTLFGCTERIMPRWKREGGMVIGLEEDGTEIVRVPVREPAHVRKALDSAHGVVRANVT
jgi:nitrate reductase / nitrite oxidoreductase, beta subunit